MAEKTGGTNLTTPSGGGAPSGAAGGDLAGTYPNPTVKASVALSGTPTAATAAVDTNTTQIATTAMVVAQAASATPIVASGAGAVGTSLRYARGDHVHPAAAVSLTSSTNYISADVTMVTPGTFYDGPSLTLAAGTWLLTGAIQCNAISTALRTFTAKLWDGTTITSKADHATEGTGANANFPFALSAIVSPVGSTTYKISATSTVANDLIKGTSPSNTNSYLLAVKIV